MAHPQKQSWEESYPPPPQMKILRRNLFPCIALTTIQILTVASGRLKCFIPQQDSADDSLFNHELQSSKNTNEYY